MRVRHSGLANVERPFAERPEVLGPWRTHHAKPTLNRQAAVGGEGRKVSSMSLFQGTRAIPEAREDSRPTSWLAIMSFDVSSSTTALIEDRHIANNTK